LTVIAALGNVMSYAGEDDAGTAGHNSRVPNGRGRFSRKCVRHLFAPFRRHLYAHENASVAFTPTQ
jgi:hypothetical protein